MKKAPLDRRLVAFEQFGREFKRITPLMVCAKIPTAMFIGLQAVVSAYVGQIQQQNRMKNITPNGMIVPKRDKVLEYNLVVRRFTEIINTFGIGPLVGSWHVPLNVRIKAGEADAVNLKRDHPTEHAHSDSWAGESAESVTVHIPLFGDTERNYLQMFYPPDDFEESWLGPRTTYLEGSMDIEHRYRKIDYVTPTGSLVIADFSTLHATTRAPGAGTRLSIDTTFVLRKPGIQGEVLEVIHPWRAEERVTHAVMSGIGETHLLYFPDAPDQQVDSRGGFKHPTNLQVLRLDVNGRAA